MRILCLILASLVAFMAHGRIDQSAPVRFGNKSIELEMSEADVRSIAGSPSQVINLVNDYGAPVGRKLVYRISGYNKRTVVVVLSGGQVVRLNECNGVVADRCD